MIQQSFVVPILKVTDRCNFRCKFCYYAQRAVSDNLMTVNLCKEIIEQAFRYNTEHHNQAMSVIFHGGEPLLQPLEFYKQVVAFEKELAATQNPFVFYNSIQTNGYLLNEAWISFLKEENFDVGISIDGNSDFNCHYGTSGVEHCTKKVLDNIALLSQADVRYGVISVITNHHTQDPEALYRFCVEHNIHDLSLNYCYNPDSGDTVRNEHLIPFVTQLFDLYANGNFPLDIREFNEMIAKYSGRCTDTCGTCDRQACGQYLSFDAHGNVYFCDTGYDKESALGNVSSESLYEILNSYRYLSKLFECRQVYETYCIRCPARTMCGGGCHRFDNKENGHYSNNYFCPTHKALAEHIYNYFLEKIGS